MYEDYTRQALPEKEYRELIGTAICVFNSNNAFIIENIIRTDPEQDWYRLIDYTSGQLKTTVDKILSEKIGNDDIFNLFSDLINRRNRIVHSYQITAEDGSQILATKERISDGNKQFIITEKYIKEFITLNEKLSSKLHNYRGY